jgi:hypothetical protein
MSMPVRAAMFILEDANLFQMILAGAQPQRRDDANARHYYALVKNMRLHDSAKGGFFAQILGIYKARPLRPQAHEIHTLRQTTT